MKLSYPVMVTSPTGKGVIVMGGKTSSGANCEAIYELSASMQWTRLDQTLHMDDHWLQIIPIPDELVSKKQD